MPVQTRTMTKLQLTTTTERQLTATERQQQLTNERLQFVQNIQEAIKWVSKFNIPMLNNCFERLFSRSDLIETNEVIFRTITFARKIIMEQFICVDVTDINHLANYFRLLATSINIYLYCKLRGLNNMPMPIANITEFINVAWRNIQSHSESISTKQTICKKTKQEFAVALKYFEASIFRTIRDNPTLFTLINDNKKVVVEGTI